jgi:hypothetical protein
VTHVVRILLAVSLLAAAAPAQELSVHPGLEEPDLLLGASCARALRNSAAYSIACLVADEPDHRHQLALVQPPGGRADATKPAAGEGFSYSINDHWTAHFDYTHSFLFDRGATDTVRMQPLADFSTDFERDVLNLQMSWQLPWSRLDLGYRFQSTRPGSINADQPWTRSLLPESSARLHAFMLGLTREWGGSD